MSYMKDSRGRRLDSFVATVDPRIVQFNRILHEETRDIHILVLGDSTGAGAVNPIRWPRRVATKLATEWPTYSVLYKG